MELAALSMILASVATGLLLRKRLSVTVGRTLFGIGLAALLLGVAVFGFAFTGGLSMWTAAGIALVSFTVGILLFPLSVALLWRRSHWPGGG